MMKWVLSRSKPGVMATSEASKPPPDSPPNRMRLRSMFHWFITQWMVARNRVVACGVSRSSLAPLSNRLTARVKCWEPKYAISPAHGLQSWPWKRTHSG